MNATARPPLNAVTRKTDPISYSKRLVNEFNLESAPGKGTRVTITRILLSPDGMAINSSRVLLLGRGTVFSVRLCAVERHPEALGE
jgi:hypothetical protein